MSLRGTRDLSNELNDEITQDSDDSTTSSRARSRSPIKRKIIEENIVQANNQIEIMAVLKPEYIAMIPEFSGERALLPRFIEVCEKLVKKFYNKSDVEDFQNDYLMSSILAKIKNKAAVNIASCAINNWNDLKTALLSTYADKRDCYTLCMELSELKQYSNESVFDFYNRIQHHLNMQVTYFQTQIPINEATILIQFFRNYALRVLLKGLRDPVGSLMRTKNPQSLNDALQMLTNDFQHDVKSFNPSTSQRATHPTSNNNFNSGFKPPNISKNYSQNPRFQSNPANTPSFNHSKTPINNNSNQRNVFQPSTSTPRNFPKPTPMSTSTTHTFRPNNFHLQESGNVPMSDESFDETDNFLEEVALEQENSNC